MLDIDRISHLRPTLLVVVEKFGLDCSRQLHTEVVISDQISCIVASEFNLESYLTTIICR